MNPNLTTLRWTSPQQHVPFQIVSNEAGLPALEPENRDGPPMPKQMFVQLTDSPQADDRSYSCFNALLMRILALFADCSGGQLEQRLKVAFSRICEFLEIQRGGVWLQSSQSTADFVLRYSYPATEGLLVQGEPARGHSAANGTPNGTASEVVSAAPAKPLPIHLPWINAQVQQGKTVVFFSLAQLPAEAAQDKAVLARLGTRSGAMIPILAESKVIGMVLFGLKQAVEGWSNGLVDRLKLVTYALANALARQQAEQALRENQARLTLAAEAAGAGLWCIESDTKRTWVTQRIKDLLQLGPGEELTWESMLQLMHPEDRERVQRAAQQALATGEELRVDHRIVLADGSVRWISSRGRRQSGVEGKEWLMGASVEITDRKRAEEQLRESEQRFRALVEQAGDGFELLDEAGNYIDVNVRTLQQLGYAREEMLKLKIFDVDTLLTQEQFAKGAASLRDGSPFRVESIHRRKDGSTFPVEVTISNLLLGTRRCTLTLVRDITQRKQAEEALLKSYAEIKQLKERLEAEGALLKSEIKITQAHGQIIGRSPGIKRVLHQVEQVAPAECAVLVSGETGTGKELVAQEIHRLSRQRDRLMVLVNCAALPVALVESELFGRERGAYTGALTSQVGRFEMADGSTIFLDEVGELSLEMQAKLLRVLQQGEFQRLGSPKTHKVVVRVIAATNRDLAEEVRRGRFREDLYYRLKVFPIAIPPLRERIEDIPLLVFSFMEEFATRMGKKLTKVPRKAMEKLQRHPWPGNIRELRNVIEHSVIVSSGDTLKLSMLGEAPIREAEPVTLAQAEREHILRTLESTAWRIKGPRGAAQRLDLEPSTLYSRMQKLGIPNRRQKDEMTTDRRSAEGIG